MNHKNIMLRNQTKKFTYMIPFIWNVQAVKFTDTESRLEVAKSCGEVQRMIDKGCVVSFYDNEML